MPRRADFRQALVAREWPLLSAGDGGEAGPDGELWFVLEHTAGPAAPAGEVFTSPHFPKHLEFPPAPAGTGNARRRWAARRPAGDREDGGRGGRPPGSRAARVRRGARGRQRAVRTARRDGAALAGGDHLRRLVRPARRVPTAGARDRSVSRDAWRRCPRGGG